jgi:hypothetical protein
MRHQRALEALFSQPDFKLNEQQIRKVASYVVFSNAVEKPHVGSILRFLRNKVGWDGKSINNPDEYSRLSGDPDLLHFAAMSCAPKVLEVAIESGCDVNRHCLREKRGKWVKHTALSFTLKDLRSRSRAAECSSVLLNAGAKALIDGFVPQPVLHLLGDKSTKEPEALQLLKEIVAKCSILNPSYWPVKGEDEDDEPVNPLLHHIIDDGSMEVLELLLTSSDPQHAKQTLNMVIHNPRYPEKDTFAGFCAFQRRWPALELAIKHGASVLSLLPWGGDDEPTPIIEVLKRMSGDCPAELLALAEEAAEKESKAGVE